MGLWESRVRPSTQNSTDDAYTTEIWQAPVPTGTTGNVVVTFNNMMGNAGIGIFRVLGAASSSHATATDNDSNPMTATINVPANGVLIGCAGENNSATYTWTNLTEKYDEGTGNTETHTGASDAFLSTQSNLAITCDQTVGNRPRLVLASWGPV